MGAEIVLSMEMVSNASMTRLSRALVRCTIGSVLLCLPVGAQEPESFENVWSERANRVHAEFELADDDRRAAARTHLAHGRFPDLLEVAQIYHLLQGKTADEVTLPLQRLVDGLNVRLVPGFLGDLDPRQTHQALVEPCVPSLPPQYRSAALTTTLTWQAADISRHGRQEPIGATNFTHPGFRMWLADPRRADDPVTDWELVPSLLVDGQRYVGMPVPVPLDPEFAPEHLALERALGGWISEGRRSFASIRALDGSMGAPFQLETEFDVLPSVRGWRRAAEGQVRGTVVVTRNLNETLAGPLTGWLGERWSVLSERGFDLVALPASARQQEAFERWMVERRALGPVIVVLRGGSVVRWTLARLGASLQFDGVVLTGSVVPPSKMLTGDVPVLWIGAGVTETSGPAVTAIEGEPNSFFDEARLPKRVGGWIEEAF